MYGLSVQLQLAASHLDYALVVLSFYQLWHACANNHLMFLSLGNEDAAVFCLPKGWPVFVLTFLSSARQIEVTKQSPLPSTRGLDASWLSYPIFSSKSDLWSYPSPGLCKLQSFAHHFFWIPSSLLWTGCLSFIWLSSVFWSLPSTSVMIAQWFAQSHPNFSNVSDGDWLGKEICFSLVRWHI